MRTPRQLRSADSTARMLDAALDLATREGLHAVTVAAVATAAGTSNGALYHRFGDRNGLLAAAQQRFLQRMEDELAAALQRASDHDDDTDAVAELVAAVLDAFGVYRGTFRAFMIDGHRDPVIGEQGRATRARCARASADWLRARFGCPATAADTAYHVLFSVGASRAVFEPDRPGTRPTAPADVVHDLTRGLLAILTGAQAGSRDVRTA